MNNPDNFKPEKLISKMNAYSVPVLEIPVPPKLTGRLAAFIADSTWGKIGSSDVKIIDVLHSAFDIDEMVDLNGVISGRLFTPRQCEEITSCLQRVYKINYTYERRMFLEQHQGIQSFIAKTDIPNNSRFAILRNLENYNATIADLLVSDKDFRAVPRVGRTAITCVRLICEGDGVNFWQYFKDD